MVDYFVDTYETDLTSQEKRAKEAAIEISDDDTDNEDENNMSPRPRKRGRPTNDRIHYLPEHPLAQSKQRIKRSPGHNNLPNFIGRYFPRRDDPEIYGFYCACMLVLLKPWRNIRTDLKAPSESWEQAFEKFVSKAPSKVLQIISGIQYLHECETAAKQRRNNDGSSGTANGRHGQVYGGLDDDFDLGEDVQVLPSEEPQTEEGLENLKSSLTPLGEELHGRHAVETGKAAKIFANDNLMWAVDATQTIANATGDDLRRLLSWRAQMEADINKQNEGADQPIIEQDDTAEVACLEITRPRPAQVTHIELGNEASEASLPGVDPSELRTDQRRAHDIVIWHLDQTLAGAQPPPLRMIIYGEGGTGKSKVIQTITDSFIR